MRKVTADLLFVFIQAFIEPLVPHITSEIEW